MKLKLNVSDAFYQAVQAGDFREQLYGHFNRVLDVHGSVMEALQEPNMIEVDMPDEAESAVRQWLKADTLIGPHIQSMTPAP